MRLVATTPILCCGLLGSMALGCATLQQFATLRQVDFSISGISDARLAGVDLERIHSFEDLGLADAARVAQAVAAKDLPLTLRLDLEGMNPADNRTDARMIRMEWTLLLENRETVSGVLQGPVVLPPGEATPIAVDVGLNLVEFFEGSARDLFDLVLSLTGRGGETKEIVLRAIPTVDTALGPIRYPSAIVIVRQEVGGDPDQ